MLSLVRAGFWIAVAITLFLTLRPIVVPMNVSDKTQHLATFAGLAGLAALAYPSQRLLRLGLALSVLGGLIEIVQPLAGRSDDVRDWIADTIGVVLALGVVWAWRRYQARGA